MIPTEQQVCTLDQAKRLKELGVGVLPGTWANRNAPQPVTLHYWLAESTPILELLCNINTDWEHYPAFTVAELGEMMPKKPGSAPEYFTCRDVYENAGVTVSGHSCWKFKKDKESINKELIKIDGIKVFTTEAQARAALIIHLIEYRMTTADEVNARLNPPTTAP